MTTTTPVSFSACWSDCLGQAINERSNEAYPIACWPNSRDHQALAAAVNVGIDAHLEAVFFTIDTDHRNAPRYWIAPDSLSTLVRRLLDGDGITSDGITEDSIEEELWDASQDLASGICQTLGIELV